MLKGCRRANQDLKSVIMQVYCVGQSNLSVNEGLLFAQNCMCSKQATMQRGKESKISVKTQEEVDGSHDFYWLIHNLDNSLLSEVLSLTCTMFLFFSACRCNEVESNLVSKNSKQLETLNTNRCHLAREITTFGQKC